MGSALSKTPKRAFPKTPAPRAAPAVQAEQPAPEAQATGSQAAAKTSFDQEQDFLRQLKQEGVKDDELGSFLDKLGGAIAPKRVSTLDIQTGSRRQAMLQREAGRLGTEDLRRLFQQVHTAEQQQTQLDVDSLASRYGIDPDLLRKVLDFNRVPAITQVPDGRLFGSWHSKG